MQKPTIKYISNRDLLAEIQRSKATFCHFIAPQYAVYDVVVGSLNDVTPEMMTKLMSKTQRTDGGIVVRVMTDTHIPPETNEKSRRRSSNGGWTAKTNFPPFKHYFVTAHDAPMEVGRSHWRNSLADGKFAIDHGKMTNRLAEMFMLLVEQYSNRSNWRGYSYVCEMRNYALVHLVQVGLQFDESRSDNPFAFYTQIIKHVFTRILNIEKRHQNIRDDLLIMAEVHPSYTRQVDNELDQRDDGHKHVTMSMSDLHVVGSGIGSDPEANLVKKEAKKRGRKPKIRL